MNEYPQNPVLVEYRRGGRVESVHRGAFVVVKAGKILDSRGDAQHPYFLRSTAKPFQTLAALEAGTGDKFGISDAELALMSASHSGEDVHAQTALALLGKGGFDIKSLRCGTHLPFDSAIAARLKAAGEKADASRHNCSGKHSGMLLLAKHLGQDPATYLKFAAPVQQKIREMIATLCGVSTESMIPATDGCSAPTYAISLFSLALGFANWTNPRSLSASLAASCQKLSRAIAANPYLFSGRKQFDTELIERTKGRVLGKRGAEGVYAIGIVGENSGIALKIDDGSNRAHAFLLLHLLKKHSFLKEEELVLFASDMESVQKNYAGIEVGETRAILS